MRIISINDVYDLDNLSRFKTLVEELSADLPRENVVVSLAGDFLAPSLLSSLDAGAGMVKVLNSIPVELVCFGNHESDIPHAKLVQRIAEFKGTWLNSNMPNFRPQLPRYVLKRLCADPGTSGEPGPQGVRTVAFMGLCIGGGRFRSVYREGAFNGAAATMLPVNEAATDLERELRQLHPEIDEIIPLTHQDLAEDLDLAETGLFPALVGGHDHDVINQRIGERSCAVVKAGMDASHAAVVDFLWPDEPGAGPEVVVRMEELSKYAREEGLAKMIERIHTPVLELEKAVVYEIAADETLTSENVRSGQVSMGGLVATALREILHCDAATINSGAIRGNRTYTGCISYGDLKRECPFPSPIVVLPMPFEVLRDAVQESRRLWWDVPPGAPPGEVASSLQVDEGVEVDAQHRPVSIGHKPPMEDHLYSVACDSRVLKRNDVLREYCRRFPERVPPDDAGRPVQPLLAEFFCGRLWCRLLGASGSQGRGEAQSFEITDMTMVREESESAARSVHNAFKALDKDENGVVDSQELTQALELRLGQRLSSRIVVEQMVAMMDSNSDGLITHRELRHGVIKMLHGQDPLIVSL